MVVCSVSIVPVGTASTSVSPYVARCHEVLRDARGLKYQLTPMATILEGELERVLEVIAELHRVTFEQGVKRVLTSVVIDDRRDKPLSMEGKVGSVRKKLDG